MAVDHAITSKLVAEDNKIRGMYRERRISRGDYKKKRLALERWVSRERREVAVTKRKLLHGWMREHEIISALHQDIALMKKRLSAVSSGVGASFASASRLSSESAVVSENDIYLGGLSPTQLGDLERSEPLLGTSAGGSKQKMMGISDMKRGMGNRKTRKGMFYAIPLY